MTHQMWTRAARGMVAALLAFGVGTTGCARARAADEPGRPLKPLVADDVVHAFDTDLGMRLTDRLELDNFLRDRDIQIAVEDGVVHLTGEVWTPLERQRAADLIRHVAGVIDVANDLDVRPPE